MHKIKDITDKISFGNSDDEQLPITECICGKKFKLWEFIIDIYEITNSKCPNCRKKLFFQNEIRVYEVVDE